mgnify:CR=1 FL=1
MEKKILSVLENAVSNGDIAGANVLVLQNGTEIAYLESGFSDIENGRVMDRSTIFRMYSQTKPVTAAAAVSLMEQGKLDAGAWLSDYLPEFGTSYVRKNGVRVQAQKHITVTDLLNMTSGIPYPGDDETGRQSGTVFWEVEQNMRSDSAITTAEFARKMAGNDLCFEPGERFMYGASADILGAVIEKVSGMSLRDYMMSTFFEPLEMSDTDFYVPQEKSDRLAKIYDYTENGLRELRVDNLGLIYERDRIPAFQSGGAGLCSTLDDYSRFALMLMNGGTYGGRKILSQASVKFLTHGGLAPHQKPQLEEGWGWMRGYTYGNLMRVCDDESMTTLFSSKGEYGWDGWAGTFFSNEPSHGITLLFGVQQAGVGRAGNIIRKIKNIVMSGLT